MATKLALSGPRSTRRAGNAPGPRPHPLLGNLPAFRRDPLGFLLGASRDYGEVVRLWIGRRPAHLLRHPDHIQEVLQTRQHDYPKQHRTLDRIGVVLGQGLVTSAGALWQRQRRAVQPAFHPHRLTELGAVMERVVHELVTRWASPAARGETIDVHREMIALAFRVVGETLLGTDLSAVTNEVRSALTVIEQQTNARLYRLVGTPLWLPTHHNREFRDAVATLDRVVYRIIAARRAARASPPDLLTNLLEARDSATGRPMSDRQLRDEILTLLLAGHENTGNALTWMWHLVSTHRDVEHRLRAELHATLGDRPSTIADLPSMPYGRMVVEETLRLYPTSWLMLRRAAAADEIGTFHIPLGSLVLISPFVTHRHPAFWPDPDRFDPERFAPERAMARHRFAYLPFGGGARKCVGSAFAALEAQLVLSAIASRYRLVAPHAVSVQPRPLVSLPPQHGLPLTIRACGARTEP